MTDLSRKVAQQENDISEIYDMLAGIQRTQRSHTAELRKVRETLDQHSEQLAEILSILKR